MSGLAIVPGAVLVFLYTWHRFSEPSANRSSTTAVRYYLAAAFYCLWGLFVYATLIIALAASPESARKALIELVSTVGLGSLSSFLPAEILAAVLVTVLLPKVPVIASADGWVRQQIEYMASIPYEVRRLAAELERSDMRESGVTYRMPAATEVRVRERMQAHELAPGTTGEIDLGSTWTKVSALVVALADWRTDSRLASVCHTCAVAIDEIVQAHEDLVPRVRRCLRVGGGTPTAVASGSSPASAEYAEEVERQVKTLLGKVYHALAAATLRCDLTHHARAARLAKLGFRFDDSLHSTPIVVAHRLTALYAGLAFGFFVVKVILGHLFPPTPGYASPGYRFILALSVAVPLTYVVAVLWAIFLKRSWGGTTRPRSEARPFIAYLLSGLLAAASNLPIALGLSVLAAHMHGQLQLLEALAKSMVWLLLSFVTAATTAFLIDDQPRAFARRWVGRWSEGAVQGIVTAAIACLVGILVNDITPAAAEKIDLRQLIPVAGAIGFTVGVFVPTWYRKPVRRQPRRTNERVRRRRRVHRAPSLAVAERPTASSRIIA
jgi:hypothetical protein